MLLVAVELWCPPSGRLLPWPPLKAGELMRSLISRREKLPGGPFSPRRDLTICARHVARTLDSQ